MQRRGICFMSLRGGRSVVARLFLRRLSICGETAHIRVKNSLSSGSNIISKPSSDKPLTWYSCGPTVYDNAHLGHARTYICTDIIRRILNDYFKLDVIFAMGVTDIDDKIVKRAEETGQNWKALAQKYESAFLSDMKNLNVREPDALLRVTEHVEDIIEYVRKIHQSGKAYESEDGVYFSVSDLGSRYGKLGRSLADEVATDDLDSAKVKRDPRDFALWKKTNTLPNWDSPWGKGRPGWHIECSAMTNSYFGPDVDIHSGGIDLAFPHHTNEIVQCEAHNNSDSWVKYWIHTGHLHIEGRKMSKSLKNFISIKDYMDSKWSNNPSDDMRIYFLQHKYSATLQFSKERIEEAAAFRRKIEHFLESVETLSPVGRISKQNEASRELMTLLHQSKNNIYNSLGDDFNTPLALKYISDLVGMSIQTSTAAATDPNIAIEPLQAISRFVSQFLEMLGLSFTVNNKMLQTDSKREIAVIDSFVKFRSDIRKSTLAELKKLKSAEPSTLKDDALKFLKKNIDDCDTARESMLAIGVAMVDNSTSASTDFNGKSWRFVEATNPKSNS